MGLAVRNRCVGLTKALVLSTLCRDEPGSRTEVVARPRVLIINGNILSAIYCSQAVLLASAT